MIVSLLRERRPGERRVLLLPPDAAILAAICDLQVETGAGLGLDIPDDAYARAGARITGTRQAWESAGLLPKLKAPSVAEVQRIRPGTAIAALFHAEGTPSDAQRVLSGIPPPIPRLSFITNTQTCMVNMRPCRAARSPPHRAAHVFTRRAQA
jgi:NAD(P) transhydrogenase subunit alpha